MVLRHEGDAFAAACARAGLGAPVGSCPGWSVADLCWHLTAVHHFWAAVVRERRTAWEGHVQPTRPADSELLERYRAGLDSLIDVLAAADPSQTNWTWSHQHDAAFVVRRMAQETAVHRWDAEDAAGEPSPIDAQLASDGIDEFLEHFLSQELEGSVHLHCTDVDGEWLVRSSPQGKPVLTREHAKGDAAIRGAASDMLLVLWRRLPATRVELVGDAATAERFLAITDLG